MSNVLHPLYAASIHQASASGGLKRMRMTLKKAEKWLEDHGDVGQAIEILKQEIAKFQANQLGVESLSFDPTAKLLATGGANGTINLWSWETKQQLSELLDTQD